MRSPVTVAATTGHRPDTLAGHAKRRVQCSNLQPSRSGSARLLPGEFLQRYELNRRYLLSLRTENLLQSHYMEAGLSYPRPPGHRHPLGVGIADLPIRGTFLGALAVAAARGYAWHGDTEIKAAPT